MKKVVMVGIGITAIYLQVACAYQPYDASNPNKYVDYWCQQDNIKNSLAYQLQFDPAVDNGGQNNDRSIDNSSQENIRKQQCEIIRLSRMSLPVQ